MPSYNIVRYVQTFLLKPTLCAKSKTYYMCTYKLHVCVNQKQRKLKKKKYGKYVAVSIIELCSFEPDKHIHLHIMYTYTNTSFHSIQQILLSSLNKYNKQYNVLITLTLKDKPISYNVPTLCILCIFHFHSTTSLLPSHILMMMLLLLALFFLSIF